MTSSDKKVGRHFWPTRQEARATAWALLLFLFIPFAAFAPLVALRALRLLPAGDDWTLVAARVGAVATFVGLYQAWIKGVVQIARRTFADRLNPQLDDWLNRNEPEPKGILPVIRANLHLLVFAALGLSVFSGVIDLNSPFWKIENATKRFRGLLAVVQWCRGNPNTVNASCAMVGAGSLMLLVYRLLHGRR